MAGGTPTRTVRDDRRARVALVLGVLAWVALAVMIIAPWFDEVGAYEWPIISPRGQWFFGLLPVVFGLAWGGFRVAGETGRAAVVSVLAVVALILYYVVPWAWYAWRGD